MTTLILILIHFFLFETFYSLRVLFISGKMPDSNLREFPVEKAFTARVAAKRGRRVDSERKARPMFYGSPADHKL